MQLNWIGFFSLLILHVPMDEEVRKSECDLLAFHHLVVANCPAYSTTVVAVVWGDWGLYTSTHIVIDSASGSLLTVPLMIHKKLSEFNQSSLIIRFFQ